jgi:hypothetical protein
MGRRWWPDGLHPAYLGAGRNFYGWTEFRPSPFWEVDGIPFLDDSRPVRWMGRDGPQTKLSHRLSLGQW